MITSRVPLSVNTTYVMHMCHSSTTRTCLHPTPKGEAESGWLPASCFNSINAMEQRRGNLVSSLEQRDVINRADWRSMRPPRATDPGMLQDENSRLGPPEWPLSRRVWKTVETKLKTRKRCDSSGWEFLEPERVQHPHSPSLKGNQNLSQISGTQCKSPFAPFCPKTATKNLRDCC